MDEVLLLIRLFLFGVFALAGIAKLLDLHGSEAAVKGFGVPDPFARIAAVMLPVFEIIIALLLLPRSTAWFAAILALLLLLVFMGGMIFQLAKGNAPDCHCFGQIHSEPIGKVSIIRNGVFAFLALFLAVQGSDGQGRSLAESDSDMTSTILVLGILTVLIVVVFYLKRIFEQQTEILRRIELLDLIAREGATVEREEAVPPAEGLAIGSPFPEFELKTLDGDVISSSDIFKAARPSLLFFVSPDCSPCKAIYPEIKEWQAELGDRLDFVFVSSGKLETNAKKFGDAENIRVLVQKDREVSEMVRAQWTPSALFADGQGRIASFVASGDAAIRQLIDDVRERDLNSEFVYVVNSNGASRDLPIGTEVPEFALTAVNGEQVTDAGLRGKKTLAIFWSNACPHCGNMKEALAKWDGVRGVDDPELIVFSDGDIDPEKELGLRAPVVVDEGFEVAKTIGMFGTPSAVVINENGVVATSTATGAAKIWALIGRRDL
jgi:peroxiredoxin/uncharacterized membrane protein YphA (DoxX/SURF4 family)